MTQFQTCFWILCGLLTTSNTISGQNATFPRDFVFGASTAAYQIEGAWNTDGKGWSIWDHLVRTHPSHIADRSNGDIAANSYYNYKRDVQMLLELGADSYRFSVSWTRVLPYGKPDYINPSGVAYYNRLIDELLANGITPFVTMYHWDLPQNLQEQGGWLNEDVVDWFGNYTRVLYDQFGDRVKHWFTVNEPYIHCKYGYGYAQHAPLIKSPGIEYYECIRNYMLAHARAYHVYEDEFKDKQKGEVGIVVHIDWGMIENETVENKEALLDYYDFEIHMFLQPILSKQGDFPERVKTRVATNSFTEGFNVSRLRPYSAQEVEYLKGTADLIGINTYSSTYIYRNQSLVGKYEVPSIYNDKYYVYYVDPAWPVGANEWGPEHAPGVYNLVVYLTRAYPGVKYYITENGMGSTTGLNDTLRANYHRNYLAALSQAVQDGANVKGYFPWSLMDNFEWADGFNLRFGLYEVNMSDPLRTRTPRKSALVYQNIVKNRAIDFSYDPDPYVRSYGGSLYVGWIFRMFSVLVFYFVA